MTLLLLTLFSVQSSCFLRMVPGVAAQGLGGSSILVNEGLSAFHNPAQINNTKVSAVLSRWHAGTHYLAIGGEHNKNALGLSYFDYGSIQGYDANGNPTSEFRPYNFCLVYARRFGFIGTWLKGFNESIDKEHFSGIAAGISSYLELRQFAFAFKVDNLGKEFAQSTDIPMVVGVGAKVTLPNNTFIFLEFKHPDSELSAGVKYYYQTISLFLGTHHISPYHDISAIDIGGGIILNVENYQIGYSIILKESFTAHQFGMNLDYGN